LFFMGTLLVRGLLVAALLLTFVFPAWAQDGKGIGVVTALTGRAGLKRLQAPETPLKLRDNLFVRDVVDTQKESLARILLMGKSTVTVRELSRFEIREEVRPDGSQRALINLAEGRIRVMVARRLMRPGDEVEIRTPNAIAAVRGSDGVIEVSQLPDGRPQTVITGVSGEFHLTLPSTPPFIANGKEFQDGPALAGGALGTLIAMAETTSDAGPGVRVAQLPTGLNVTALVQAQITGAAGAQALAQALLTQAQVRGLTAGFHTPLSASGSRLSSTTTDKVAANGEAAAQSDAAATGLFSGAAGGGGGQTTGTPVFLPCNPCTPPVISGSPLYEVIHQVNIVGVMEAVTLVKTVGPQPGAGTGSISVLVYNYGNLATTVNGLTGSGSVKLFNATSMDSSSFALLSKSQIQGYQVLLIGTGLDAGGTTGLLANANVGAAVNGNQVITGLHIEHATGQANQFLTNAIQFSAKAGPGTTGLVAATDGCVAIACTGGSGSSGWITKPGSFLQSTFEGKVNRDKALNDVSITKPSNPVNSGSGLAGGAALTNTGLSSWGQSAHSTFTCTGKPGATC
jgi:hypothetical protein